MKYLLILISLLISVAGMGQEKRLIAAQEQYNKARYAKALSSIEKVMAHKETRSNAAAYMLHAKINLVLFDDPNYPKALFDALKSVEKAFRKSKTPLALIESEAAFLNELRDRCMQEGYNDLGDKRYIQADKYFIKVFEVMGWYPARWGQARVALALEDSATALFHVREVVNWISADTSAAVLLGEPGPIIYFVNHHLKKKQYDSAAFYSELGSDLFPKSVVLKNLLLESFLYHVTARPPELYTLEFFAQMRPRFKQDSLFLLKENVLFLNLINRFSAGDEQGLSDSLLEGFIAVKNGYYSEFGEVYLKKDQLYNPNNQEIIFNLIRYAARLERKFMMALLLKSYVSGKYADSTFQSTNLPLRWKNLFERVGKENSVFLLMSSLKAANEDLKKEVWFAAYKKDLVLKALNNSAQFKDRTALYSFVPYAVAEYTKDPIIRGKAQQLSLNIIREYTDSAWFSYAKLSIKQHDRLFPKTEAIQALKKEFVIVDYKTNYFGSRLLKKEVKGVEVSEFVWNGNALRCDAGSVPENVQMKVEQRINYFRRTAGIPDYVNLDTLKNQACQKAALIYEVNPAKRFTEPAETWKCYALSAVDASRFGARIIGQTTVFAVTSIMADQGDQNTFVGNRRWLLYPPARTMGHGSTSKTAIIWTLDESGDKDSTEYMNEFVSWPPRDYCPLLFAFQRWNFSMHADLSQAKVSVTENGKPFPVKQEKQVSGYGMPTLVWTPENKPSEGKTYTITVQGIKKHGESKPSSYTYSVEFIDPMK